MNKFCFVFLLLMGWSLQSEAQGIQFEHDTTLAAVKAKARKANKPIFIDCYTTWCGPCKWMANNIFPNDTVGQFFNENFISMKMDMEKGDGKIQAIKYNVSYYPTFLFLDTSGREMQRVIGTQKAKEFIANAQKSLDPQNRFSALQDRYKKGERDPAFLRKYMLAAWQARDPNLAEMADWYFAFLPESELVTKENFEVLERTVTAMHQPGFEKLLKHHEKFCAVAGKANVNDHIKRVVNKSFEQAIVFNNEKQRAEMDDQKYAEAVKKVKALDFEGKEEILSKQNMQYHFMRQDLPVYIADAKAHVSKYSWNDAAELNTHAWNFYGMTDKKEDLEMALNWSKRSVELSDNCYFNDTYAALFQKLKRKKEALKYAQKALELAKQAGENLKDYEDRVEAIKKM